MPDVTIRHGDARAILRHLSDAAIARLRTAPRDALLDLFERLAQAQLPSPLPEPWRALERREPYQLALSDEDVRLLEHVLARAGATWVLLRLRRQLAGQDAPPAAPAPPPPTLPLE